MKKIIKTDWKTYFFLIIMTIHDGRIGIFLAIYGFWMALELFVELRKRRKKESKTQRNHSPQ